ncbi:MAG: hypothetical protein QOF73_345 [Thermomicrobiales bacterium]|nr:hypothetical protein [Thermomicrobiales bacterium]
MKHRAVAVLLIGILALILPGTASAARVPLRGGNAFAFFISYDASGCVETAVFVLVSLGDRTEVGISVNDSCEGKLLMAARGSAPLGRRAFTMRRSLETATLKTSVTADDAVTGASFRVQVTLTWRGHGATSQDVDNFHAVSPGFRVDGAYSGVSRFAEAKGVVAGPKASFTPEPALFAPMMWVSNGEVILA